MGLIGAPEVAAEYIVTSYTGEWLNLNDTVDVNIFLFCVFELLLM